MIIGAIVLLLLIAAVWIGFELVQAESIEPARAVAIIAESEGVSSDQVELLALESVSGEVVALYSVSDGARVRMRRLVPSTLLPWRWTVGGGSDIAAPSEHATASIGLRSGSGSESGAANTIIFGVTIPEAAEIAINVDGDIHVRDLRHTTGFVVVLSEENIEPSDIEAVRILASDGSILPAPSEVTSYPRSRMP